MEAMDTIVKKSLNAPAAVDMALVTGPADANLRLLEQAFNATITVRGNRIDAEGDANEVESLLLLFADLFKQAEGGKAVTEQDIRAQVSVARTPEMLPQALRDDIILAHRGRSVRPKTGGQKRYVDAVRANTITFGLGPAGTGKTYLAVACAIAALKAHEVSRIVLSRPIVEAGENLGFLPGTLMEKVNPYMRPLYDALYDMEDFARINQLIDSNVIEIVPLAFMRGRTLNDSFIILDEAQNATAEQMKMFLTRLGFGSKMVVTGDATQMDIPHAQSGLKDMRFILEGVRDIAFCNLSSADVVRHSLVADIVAAYERANR